MASKRGFSRHSLTSRQKIHSLGQMSKRKRERARRANAHEGYSAFIKKLSFKQKEEAVSSKIQGRQSLLLHEMMLLPFKPTPRLLLNNAN
jgi:hypothetical protein